MTYILLYLASLIMVMIGAMMNASMDITTHRYGQSIFSIEGKFDWLMKLFRFDPNEIGNDGYFNPKFSWQNKYEDSFLATERAKFPILWGLINITHPAFFDFWHLAKSIMIISWVFSVGFYGMALLSFGIYPNEVTPLLMVAVLVFPIITHGYIWNKAFMIFYKDLLMK